MGVVTVVFETVEPFKPCTYIEGVLVVGIDGDVVEVAPGIVGVFRGGYAVGENVGPFSVFKYGDVPVDILFVVEVAYTGRGYIETTVVDGEGEGVVDFLVSVARYV